MKVLDATYWRILQAGICLATLLAGLMGHEATSAAQLPPRPTPDLPLRPPVNPAQPSPTPSAPSLMAAQPTALGAHIVLMLNATGEEYWTEVEWEGLPGNWYRVDGWQTMTTQHTVTWFVREADFRKGPFRWQVYDRPGGALLASTSRFFLPEVRGSVVAVQVAWP